jgi:hypothetical protein
LCSLAFLEYRTIGSVQKPSNTEINEYLHFTAAEDTKIFSGSQPVQMVKNDTKFNDKLQTLMIGTDMVLETSAAF